jgi:hypothetical protein
MGISLERLSEHMSAIFGYPRRAAAPMPSHSVPFEESRPARGVPPHGTE